jgi:hypothetical protein
MNTNAFLLLGAVLVLALGGWFVFGDYIIQRSPTATTTPQNSGPYEPLDTTYISPGFDFTLQHASTAKVTVEGGNHTKFLYDGAVQPTTTELQEGYMITVSAYDPEEYDSLEVLAGEQLAHAQALGTITQELQATTFHSSPAYAYESETVGAPTMSIFVASPAWLYHISYSTVGQERALYDELVDGMLESFTTSPALVPTDSADNSAVLDRVSIAFLDTEQTTSGKERGCDRVVMVEERIVPTTTPLTAALQTLFALERQRVTADLWYNFISQTNDTLTFDRVTVQNGVAKVYLEGELTGLAGVCDNPRAQIQIEETALNFPTVNSVEIYLNGELTDLTPDERG